MLISGVHLSSLLKVARWELDVDGKVLKTEADIVSHFNHLGTEGWELISTNNGSDAQGNISKIIFIFKRPRAQTPVP